MGGRATVPRGAQADSTRRVPPLATPRPGFFGGSVRGRAGREGSCAYPRKRGQGPDTCLAPISAPGPDVPRMKPTLSFLSATRCFCGGDSPCTRGKMKYSNNPMACARVAGIMNAQWQSSQPGPARPSPAQKKPVCRRNRRQLRCVLDPKAMQSMCLSYIILSSPLRR